MASKVDICNRGLSYLGAGLITSFDENTKEARYCKLFYNDVLEDTLRSHPWNFATTRIVLNQVDIGLTDGLFAYQLPADCLRPLCNAYNERVRYDIEDRYLITNEATFTLKYIRLEEDVNKYDVMFRTELAQALAVAMCQSLTNSSSREQELRDMFREQKAFTQNVDSQDDNEVNYLMDGEMLNVRLVEGDLRGSYAKVP